MICRWNFRFCHALIPELLFTRISISCRWLLHAQLRDLAGHNRRVFWPRESRLHTPAVPTRRQGHRMGFVGKSDVDTILVSYEFGF
jgi:hypothetical protein